MIYDGFIAQIIYICAEINLINGYVKWLAALSVSP